MRRKPSLRFLLSHPAHFIAMGFGAGLSPIAPGTVGTLVALPLAALLHAYTDDLAYLLVVAAAFDVVKPPPAGFIDREWHHGFGEMADDVVAAFYALLVFALWQRIFL